jgi:DNA-binding XRE family transcriptional regulator
LGSKTLAGRHPRSEAFFRKEPLTQSASFLRGRSQLREGLGRRIRELRLSSKMTQRELAEDAQIRQALVSAIERGEANPTLDSVLRIAIALDVSFADLFRP